MRTIYTLDARDYLLIDSMANLFSLSNADIRVELIRLHTEMTSVLERKNVSYDKLKSMLTPQSKRAECALIFDSRKTGRGNYIHDAVRHLLPLLHPKAKHSIQCGDIISHGHEAVVFELLAQAIVTHRPVTISHTGQLFCIYLNNMSPSAIDSIDRGLGSYDAYVGHIPTTYASSVRTFLSTTVSQSYLKDGRTMIGLHEDDVSNDGNYNLLGWPVEEFGYTVVSLSGPLYRIFLSYKIERDFDFEGAKTDRRYSFLALAADQVDFDALTVSVADSKGTYLATKKTGSLKKAGLLGYEPDALAELIQAKISSNYIYFLREVQETSSLLLNVMLDLQTSPEHGPARLTCGLEYEPDAGNLKLTTMY